MADFLAATEHTQAATMAQLWEAAAHSLCEISQLLYDGAIVSADILYGPLPEGVEDDDLGALVEDRRAKVNAHITQTYDDFEEIMCKLWPGDCLREAKKGQPRCMNKWTTRSCHQLYHLVYDHFIVNGQPMGEEVGELSVALLRELVLHRAAAPPRAAAAAAASRRCRRRRRPPARRSPPPPHHNAAARRRTATPAARRPPPAARRRRSRRRRA